MSSLSLSSIYRYPIKSAQGHKLDSAQVDRFGLVGDRRWMLVDQQGQFLSQRSHSELALLEAKYLEHGLELRYAGAKMVVQIPDSSGPRVLARVWQDTVAAVLADQECNAWLSEMFDDDVRLVYYPDTALRGVDPDRAPVGQLIAFSDGFPLLIISEASLDGLNARLNTPVPMDRFRPNLVIAGAKEHAEDAWNEIRIGSAEITLADPCSRCAIPGIDQATGKRDSETLGVLAQYRSRGGISYFGMNAYARPGSVLAVGDQVEVIA